MLAIDRNTHKLHVELTRLQMVFDAVGMDYGWVIGHSPTVNKKELLTLIYTTMIVVQSLKP